MNGHIHPITITIDKVCRYFEPLGFEIVTGLEVVSSHDNFDALNIPANHPARAMHDTFYIENNEILRTHMSSLYAQAMKNRRPPVRLLFPGRVFRNEATDATHGHTFYQIDGLVIDTETNMRHLIGSLQGLMRELFGQDLAFRIRSSYFPFTEPSIELDIRKPGGGWLEILGAGMVHPNVIKNLGLDPEKYQGYAFGVGPERLLSLISQTGDVRLNFNSDYRYLGQFQ